MRHERDLQRPRERTRILQIVNSFHFGGTEGQVVELLRGLPPRYGSLVATLHAEGHHLDSVRAMGLEPQLLRVGPSLQSVATAREVLRLARWLRRENVELVHAHDFYSAMVSAPAARLAGVKLVVSRVDLSHWLTPLQKLAQAVVAHLADRVVCNAEAIKAVLVRRERVPESRITVLRNGIDLARFDRLRSEPLRKRLARLDRKTVLVHVANMSHPVKAQEDLLAALRELLADNPNLVLLLVGDGARRAMLEQLAQRLGVAGAVQFLGHRSDVPAILARADIGVLCSRAEGLSNAVIESMAAGLPMVVTDAGGNKELVRDGQRGFVVPVGAPGELAAKLKVLIDSPQLRDRMGRAGRAFVEAELNKERYVARHDALYKAVLGIGRGRAIRAVPGRAPGFGLRAPGRT